jgi:stage V sporulation protein G
MIQSKVIQEFQLELERAKQPGYVSRYDDEYPGDGGHSSPEHAKPAVEASQSPSENAPPNNHRVEAGEPAPQGPHRAVLEPNLAKKKPAARAKSPFGEGIF